MGKKLRDMNELSMEFMLAIFETIKRKEKESLNGPMANVMKENGLLEKDMELDCGSLPKEIAIWESGNMEKLKEKGSIRQVQVKDIREDSKIF